ncbi:conserved membrane hypothetical protein [Thiomonas arsenitoxydans]|uniref:Uncharacterized protein n=1 Tax=Thiomonas arsenitoxydans (strain DSM 22701 / CIP 110005 / 3As) TaxID=426114 RepID=D6CSA0_THIA3|nr:hypothetical protein [Thiomonas arsenitoxydans]CAZ87628.1 Conserved hypothetical protein; putative membrane protein [Thiomonas arsenitoxydans]CQR26946.1 conserved membrane hypothetical protein [Thiomonas arsenitoxydans]CQR30220.1 conserved membrane hypothetical protein [Thiomonas arsenitoxydans]CQR30277.1 conserved membrane hypothetical protein [Thiomonas arsenitoxydans]CQR32339.1 conserved membrane hypothetical protein [Thiomonas arsenitoxydans]
MLNMDAAASARNRLKTAVDCYNSHQEQTKKLAEQLYALRRSSSEELIGPIESFVNGLASIPKEFNRAFAAYHVELQTFDGVVAETDTRLKDIKVTGSTATGAGVAAGATTAMLAPTAAMAIATTFGTASTGTAIATLSGAAASNAALAWLGGGAIAAGGGGMSGGGALLALAGPIGWGFAGAAAVAGAVYVANANSNVAKEADEKLKPIEIGICTLKLAIREILQLLDLTREHVQGMNKLFSDLSVNAPKSYAEFDAKQKQTLAALINHVQSLSALLNKKLQDASNGAY